MKTKNIIIIGVILIILSLIFGIFVGILIYRSYNLGLENALSLSIYACHDGCSIATKNKTTGFLINDTFDCWEECNKYIERTIGDLIK